MANFIDWFSNVKSNLHFWSKSNLVILKSGVPVKTGLEIKFLVSDKSNIWFLCVWMLTCLFVCWLSTFVIFKLLLLLFEGKIGFCVHPLTEPGSWNFWLHEMVQPDSPLPRALHIFFCIFISFKPNAQSFKILAETSSKPYSSLDSCPIWFGPPRISLTFFDAHKNLKRCRFLKIL